ncbi:MAG: ABC transporter ATP-binding protein [Acholeplasma sp.]|nr:ABC transporter ATP-binding protein [Acholeplasma sp.]
MNKLIELKDVCVDYNENDNVIGVINNVSLVINKNDFICLLGPSGCGKSTLLKTIAGFIKPNKGEALMDGEIIVKPESKRGIIFQDANLFPWFTVFDNIALGPKFMKKDKEEINAICEKYLEQVELSEYRNSKVFELSGGQRQRVAIARTLANNPEVILMDEPFGALDSFTRKKMQIMIRKLWHQNKSTIFFVTHDIDEALLLGTDIYIMKSGVPSIVKKYEVNYSKRLLDKPNEHVTKEKEYIKLKEEILDLLEN